ncbi:MAG: substrate-binding domain-containing protein [Anaerolineae bacterium]|nr:substrate-binding domain-containing protein [Anaerolineae bacterium]
MTHQASLVKRLVALVVLFALLFSVTQFSQSLAQGESKFGEEMARYDTIQSDPGNIETWALWDKEGCAWKQLTPEEAAPVLEAAGRPTDTYTAILRKGLDNGVKIAWGPEDQVFDTLIVANKSFADASAESGVEVKLFDNAYPSTEAPITAAEQMVQYKPDVVISMLVLADLHPAVLEIFKQACLPVIGHSVPHEGQPFFGGSFLGAGKLAAEYLGKVATDKGWKPETTNILLCSDKFQKIPGTPYDGIVGFREVIAESFPGVPETQIEEIDCPSTVVDDEARVADWLTAHPSDNTIIMFGLNDLRALGMYNAVKAAGIEDRVILGGVGVSKEAQEPICNNDPLFLMSVDFVPQLWGQYGIAMAEDVIDGIPIPWRVLPKVQAVDAKNIRDIGLPLCADQK